MASHSGGKGETMSINHLFLEQRIGKILTVLAGSIYSKSLPVWDYRVKRTHERGLEMAGTGDWENFDARSQTWQGWREDYWFVTDVTVPEGWEGETVFLRLSTGSDNGWEADNPQFYVYVNGRLVQGLDTRHREFRLAEQAKVGETYHVALFAYTSENKSVLRLDTTLAALDKETEQLYYDIKVPYDTALLLDENDKTRIDMVLALNETINRLDLRVMGSKEYHASVKEALEYIRTEFYEKQCGGSEAVIRCVGHTHIDVAWLWTLSVTRDKAVRTFATMLELMNQYPEFIFMSSQPQLYQYVKEDAPEVYEELKRRVKEGRWEAEGAMFLEADCNISSGEALVRQVLYGTRFFEKEFGVKNRILWLPDVFGYSAALPQILKKSGIDYFMTTKISWNEYNKLPYDTFQWRGIDGTEVLTHFIPASDYQPVMRTHFTTYNGNLVPKQVKGAWQRYQQKELNQEALFAFGYGDGGGGTTKEMLENDRRMEKGIPGCPRVQMSTSRDFFEQLERDVAGNRYLPTWSGELYLEYHRGTYTSMARNKKYNRKSEFLLQSAEKLGVMDQALLGGSYPAKKLDDNWEVVLRNQFHDILPGSSIKEVYEDSQEEYEGVKKQVSALLTDRVRKLHGQVARSAPAVTVFNTAGTVLSDVVEVMLPEEVGALSDPETGKVLPVQRLANGNALFFAPEVPANGYKTFYAAKAKEGEGRLEVEGKVVCTPFYTVEFDEKAQFISLYDKVNGREVLKAGEKGNVITAYEDRPHKYDNWDVNIYYQEKSWVVDSLAESTVEEAGPVRLCLKVVRPFLSSTITQRIYFYSDQARIDVANDIDWKEENLLLKAAFPVDVHAEEASYEIQYGNVTRPCHSNTLWDAARFEVCAHKWTDFSEDGYGVSLLNDCKFGYDIHDGVMRLTMLKAGTYPNPEADKERHTFTYSLYPHAGGWRTAGTVAQAYALNLPLLALCGDKQEGTLPDALSLVQVDCPNVIVEAVKKAQDSQDTVVRLYECYNRRTRMTVTLAKAPKAVFACNLLEREATPVEVEGKTFTDTVLPYEIKSYLIQWD